MLHLKTGIADHDEFGGFAAAYLENFWLIWGFLVLCGHAAMPFRRKICTLEFPVS
jgi:hypothetical protein